MNQRNRKSRRPLAGMFAVLACAVLAARCDMPDRAAGAGDGVETQPELEDPPVQETPDWHGLRLSEICYDPAGNDTGKEFIEVRNNGAVPGGLAGCMLADGSKGCRRFVFPAGSLLAPGTSAVVGSSIEGVEGVWGVRPAYGPFSFTLNNSSEYVVLLSPEGAVIDQVFIRGGIGDFPAPESWGSADLPAAPQGKSLHRSPAEADTDTAADWLAADPSPGT